MKLARGVDCAVHLNRPLPTMETVVTVVRVQVTVTVHSSRNAEALDLHTPTNGDFAVAQPSSTPYSQLLISHWCSADICVTQSN